MTDHDKPDPRQEALRDRRRRINEAFRNGDLETCLREISAGLAEEPDDETLAKALRLVQGRFLDEVLEPAVREHRWTEARAALEKLGAPRDLPPELRERLEALTRRVEAADHEDVAARLIRKAEEAWASGRHRHARDLLRHLEHVPLGDRELQLRYESLARLMAEETKGVGPRRTVSHGVGWWVIVVVGVVGAVLGGAVLVGRRPSAPPGGQTPSAELAEPAEVGWFVMEVTPPEASVYDSLGDLESGALVARPPGLHRVVVRAEGYTDTTVSLRVAPGETLVVSVALSPKPPPQGTLSLRSDPPGAHVLDASGEKLGVTPVALGLPPGTHRLLLTAEGRVSEWVEVAIRPGEMRDTVVALSPRYAYGRLQINAVPWAFVFVNGESLGPTPLTTGDLPTGVELDCVFKRPDGSVVRQKVRLDPKRGTPTPLIVGEATPAVLAIAVRDSITGRPTWAHVWVGARRVGDAPGEFSLSPGEVTVRLEREGYHPTVRKVMLSPGTRATLSVQLVPKT